MNEFKPNDFDKMIIGSNWEPDEDYVLYDYLEKLDRERKIRGLTKKEKREEAKEYLPELLSYPIYFDINEKQELKEIESNNGYTITYSLVENNKELYRATIEWSKSVIKIELFGNNPKTLVLTGDEAEDLINAFYDIMEEKEYMMAEAIADVFHSKGYFK